MFYLNIGGTVYWAYSHRNKEVSSKSPHNSSLSYGVDAYSSKLETLRMGGKPDVSRIKTDIKKAFGINRRLLSCLKL